MATDFLPFDEWVAGTLQNSVPANSNALRSEAVIANVISDTLDAQPVSPVDGDCYIIPAAATGTQWATFAEGSLAYFRAGTWYEFSAFEGLLKVVAGEIQIYSGTTWVPYAGGSAGSGGGGAVPVQEEGVTVVASPTAINFVGAGATVTDVGGVATVTIPGGGGGGDAYPTKWRGAYTAVATTNTITTYNLPALQTVFTLTFGAITGTNVLSSRPRVGTNNVAASTSAFGGFRSQSNYCIFSNSPRVGGFKHRFIMGVGTGADVSTHRLFIGLNASNAAPTDVEPSSRVNIIGIGYDGADANLQFMHNDSTGTATKIDLGSGLPKPSVVDQTMYDLVIESAPGSGTVSYTVTDLHTGNSASGTATTDLPAGDSVGFWSAMSAGGVTSTSIRLWLSNVEVEV